MRLAWSLFVFLLASAQADSLEQTVARSFVKDYKPNEARLEAIETELKTLPRPYLREPTGTGGFLSHAQKNPTGEVVLTFRWKTPVELDAVALFPLRLFMDEVYGENLYWPGSISIEVETGGQTQRIAQGAGGQPLLRQSLPELIEFDPVVTRRLVIRCTDLPQHLHEKWHAAGFAEIFIFSGAANVAPRASVKAVRSRQGYYVLAREFLTDAQTPLGLPEQSSQSGGHGFVKKIGFGNKELANPYTLTLTYPEPIPVDTVRIDPAIQHSYGQGFPVRFTVDLLDDNGRILQSDTTYEEFPLRNPGLNPHFSYFPETSASAVRLRVLEASQSVPEATPAIAFSEISPIHQGVAQARATVFEEVFRGRKLRLTQGDPLDSETKQMLASANDGLTQSGPVLPLRKWVEGLVHRQQLMEEQLILRNAQEQSLIKIGDTLVLGSLTLLILGIGSALFFVVRSRVRTRREIRIARAKIASDLHDDVGSNLGSIILHVEKLQDENKNLNAQQRLKSIYRLTRESVFGLREVLHTSAPEVGRAQDIVAYMRELAGLLLGKTSHTFEVAPSLGEELSDNALRKGLLLFYKEAIYNAKTHADCSHIDISLHKENGSLVLNVKDDGKGIDKQELKKARTLRTLKQRAEWLHAGLKIESTPGQGTELVLSIPKGNPQRSR